MMFRTLRTRLVGSYVVAAFFLVAIVGLAITAFGLSSFGYFAQQSVASVARVAPDIVRDEIRGRTLKAAAPGIVRRLAHPGVRIAVMVTEHGVERVYALSTPDSDRETSYVIVPAPRLPAEAGGGGPARTEGTGARTAGSARDPFWLRSPGTATSPVGAPASGGAPTPAADKPPFLGLAPFRVVHVGTGQKGVQRLDFPRPDFPFRLNVLLGLHPERVAIATGDIIVFPDPRPLESAMAAFWKAMLPIGLVVVVAAFFLGRYITHQALRPLVETTTSLRRFADGDFTPRPVVAERRDEIGELVRAYNGAVAQVSAAFDERRRGEERMRQFVADAGHELRTPLTVMMGFIDVLRPRAAGDSRLNEGFEIMRAESRRMRALIDKLIRLARLERVDALESPEASDVDLGETALHVISALGSFDGAARIRSELTNGVVVRASQSELHDAIANVIDNAFKYALHSPVTVRVFPQGDFGTIEIEDAGPGLSADEALHVFERFYRGEERGETEGSGLGLAIVKRTVERAGGSVGVVSAPGEGARFWMRFPLVRAAREVAAAATLGA